MSMKIKAIEIKNFKGISGLKEDVDGNIIYVKGRNGAGKSSVLEAIYAAISKVHLPEKPIKEGEGKATIKITLGSKDVELEVSRAITPKGNVLTVKENGQKVGSARTVLDALLNSISIDPFKFMSLDEKEQSELMCKACGIEFDFEEYQSKVEKEIDERKALKRKVSDLKSSIESIDVPEDIPSEDFDVVSLNKELSEAHKKNSELSEKLRKKEEAVKRIEELKEEFKELKAVAEEEFDEELLDTSEIEEKISKANEFAEVAGKVKMRNEYKKSLKEAESQLEETVSRIESLEKEKSKSLSSFKAPVEGLTTDGKKLYLGDAPFSQASSAERIEVSTRLSMLANDKLKVISIKDASLLDEEMTQRIVDVANENDYQVFFEVVGGQENVELVFEEGKQAKVSENDSAFANNKLPDVNVKELSEEEYNDVMSKGSPIMEDAVYEKPEADEMPKLMQEDVANFEETGEIPDWVDVDDTDVADMEDLDMGEEDEDDPFADLAAL